MKSLPLLTVVLFSFLHCITLDHAPGSKPNTSSSYQAIMNSDSIVLRWDPPLYDVDFITFYELYYRTSKDTTWKLVKSNIPAVDSPKITVYRSMLGTVDSIFFFAIQSIAADGQRSNMHFSSDSTAFPPYWSIHWR